MRRLCFLAIQQIALAYNSEDFSVWPNDRYGADSVVQEQLGDFGNTSIGTDGDATTTSRSLAKHLPTSVVSG